MYFQFVVMTLVFAAPTTFTIAYNLCFVVAECRNLLHQILEPNPEVRIPLSEIEIHPWLTRNGKYLFTPYVPPPRDKQPTQS